MGTGFESRRAFFIDIKPSDVLQTVSRDYKKYNFFLIFSAEYDIIFSKIRKIVMNHLD